MAIERCICENRFFSEILEIAHQRGLESTHALREAGVCCTGCRLCEPYVAEALRTGRTVFEPGERFERFPGEQEGADRQPAAGERLSAVIGDKRRAKE